MADSEPKPSTSGTKAKKAVTSATKKPRTQPSHPPTAQMVVAAINDLKERKGSSLAAVKKYIAANYKLDADKLNFHIKKALKDGVAAGTLIQTKGVGASGSFKLSASGAKKDSSVSGKPNTVKTPATNTKAGTKNAKLTEEGKATKPKAAAKKPAVKKNTEKENAAKSTGKKGKSTGNAKTPKQKAKTPVKIVYRKPKTIKVWAQSAAEARKIVANMKY